ncbi:polyketide synthase dehydratase domain-containing protein, partial [Streptomyces diastaticus]
MVLDEKNPTAVQVTVGAPDENGGRSMGSYSGPPTPWTLPGPRHADGLLAVEERTDTFEAPLWPPSDAVSVGFDGDYSRTGDGPSFQGLRQVWVRGEEAFVEVALPGDVAGDAQYFGMHPALLDAVQHANGYLGVGSAENPLLPFAWNGRAPARPGRHHAAGADHPARRRVGPGRPPSTLRACRCSAPSPWSCAPPACPAPRPRPGARSR